MVSAPVMEMGAGSPMGSRERCGQLPFPGNIALSLTGRHVFLKMLKTERKIKFDTAGLLASA